MSTPLGKNRLDSVMVGDGSVLQGMNSSNCGSNKGSSKKGKDKKNKKNKKQRGGSKKKMTTEQTLAFKCVSEWVFLDQPSSALTSCSSAASFVVDDFGVQKTLGKGGEKVVFELHSHSKFSDGFLSPSKLVERAHGNGFRPLSFKIFLLMLISPRVQKQTSSVVTW